MKSPGNIFLCMLLTVALMMAGCNGDSSSGSGGGETETAFEQKDALDAAAANLPADAELVYVATPEVDEEGQAETWVYVYYSPSSDTFYQFEATEDGVEQTDVSVPAGELGQTALPDTLIDSGVAMLVAENNGGHDFREQYDDWTLAINLFMVDTTGMNLAKMALADPVPIWEVWYQSRDAEAVGIVHGSTGECLVFQTLFERNRPMTARDTWNACQVRYPETQAGQLIWIGSSMVQPDGYNMNWVFIYLYNGQLRQTGTDGGILHAPATPPSGSEVRADWGFLPGNWIDSDAILTIAGVNGGNQYVSQNNVTAIEAYCFPAGRGVHQRPVPVWEVFYGVTPEQGLLVEINAATGAVLQ